MPETEKNKAEANKNAQPEKKAAAKMSAAELKEQKEKSRKVLERARKIHAARKAEEAKKAAEERKIRMAKRVEERKKLEEARKKAAEKKKSEKRANLEQKQPEVHKKEDNIIPTADFVDFAVTARKYKTLMTRKYMERKFWIDPNPYEIQSYIPGTIISVDVKPGKVVQEGTQLLILEAMKMQNKVEMPFTARIKKINVKPGEKIPKDFIMVELEPIDK